MKQEASGWPKWCNTEEDRYKYIEEYPWEENRFLCHWRTKKHAYTAQDQDGKISTCCKVKGITLNYKNSLKKMMITTNETSVVTV